MFAWKEHLEWAPLPFMAISLCIGTLFPVSPSLTTGLVAAIALCLLAALKLAGSFQRGMMLLALALAGMHLASTTQTQPLSPSQSMEGRHMCTGIAQTAPMRTQNGWKANETVLQAAHWKQPVVGTLFGKGSPPRFRRGDQIYGDCRFWFKRKSRNPGARAVPPHEEGWAASLAMGQPYAIDRSNPQHQPLSTLREDLSRIIDRSLSPFSRELTLALALGESGALPPSLRQLFSDTGTAHLLAISGLHLALVTGALFWLLYLVFSRIHRLGPCGQAWRLSAVCTLILGFAYTLFTHHKVPTVRAFVMLSAFLFAGILRKRHHPPKNPDFN